jgi:hypothetical protein
MQIILLAVLNTVVARDLHVTLWGAGALIVLMFWTYYSAQIFLPGPSSPRPSPTSARPPLVGLETNLTEHEHV